MLEQQIGVKKMRKSHYMRKKMIFCLAFVFMFSVFVAGCKQTRANEVEQTGTAPEKTVQAESDVPEKDIEEDIKTEAASDEAGDVSVDADKEQNPNPGRQGENTAYEAEDQYEGEAGPEQVTEPDGDGQEVMEDAASSEEPSSLNTEASSRQYARITSQPKSLDIRAGETAVFNVGVKADGLHCQWQVKESSGEEWRNSRSPGCKGTSLQVDGRTEYNGFQFRCVVSDKYGTSVTSKAASLYVFAVTKDPTEENIRKGRTATFSANAVGRGVRYQWQQHKSSEDGWKNYNGSGSTDPVLKIRDASTSFNGYHFRCKITDAAGHTSYTKAAPMYVLGITRQPSERNISKGGDASFKVSATGKNLKYEWQIKREGEDDWHSSGGSGAKTPEVSFTGVGLGSSGARFRCKITDSKGRHIYSDSVRLYVFGIASSPHNKYVKKDQHVTFEVEAEGKDLEYHWEQKKASDDDWYSASGSGTRSSRLDLGPVSTRLNGMRYRCHVYDSEGRDACSKTAVLYVLAITKNPALQDVRSGEQAVFRVSACGGGVKYSWQVRESSSGSWRSSTSSGHNTNVLRVNAGISRSGFQFRCKVSDAKGNVVYSNPATLYVPGILKNPSMQRVKEGGTAAFRVTATGRGLKYSWEAHDGYGWRSSGSTGHNTNTLRVRARVGFNGYKFRCKVRDSKGRTFYSKAATLYVLGIRSQPSDRKVDTGKTASFHVNAVGASVRYQWQIKVKNEGWRDSSSPGNKTSTLKVKATPGLDGALIRCRIKDSAGNVIYTRNARLQVVYYNFNYVPHR